MDKGRQVSPQIIVPSPAIQAVIDDDGRYFQQHPQLWERIRPYVDGEMIDERGVEQRPDDGLICVVRIGADLQQTGPVRVRVAAVVIRQPEIRAWIRELRATVDRAS